MLVGPLPKAHSCWLEMGQVRIATFAGPATSYTAARFSMVLLLFVSPDEVRDTCQASLAGSLSFRLH